MNVCMHLGEHAAIVHQEVGQHKQLHWMHCQPPHTVGSSIFTALSMQGVAGASLVETRDLAGSCFTSKHLDYSHHYCLALGCMPIQ
jgi:hypothetical protein